MSDMMSILMVLRCEVNWMIPSICVKTSQWPPTFIINQASLISPYVFADCPLGTRHKGVENSHRNSGCFH